jgi:tetratricopeptide (TPR) repeat protein
MVPVAQLVDLGVRAYVEGRLEDARRLLEDALRRDPANARARSYLILLHGGLPAASPPPAATTPAPVLPPPPAAAPPAGSPPAAQAAPPGAAPGAAEAPALTPAPFEVTIDEEEYAPSPWDEGPAAAATIVLESDGGLDLGAVADKSDLRTLVPEAPAPAARDAGRAAPPGPRDVDVWMAAAKDLHALGDFSGSLEMIEKILKVDPEHGEARDYLRQNESTLVAMYESKLGPLGRIPRLAIKPEEVMWLNLDHRAGFLLSQIDGTVDFESLFALSGLPRLDTARILATLIGDGVIAS